MFKYHGFTTFHYSQKIRAEVTVIIIMKPTLVVLAVSKCCLHKMKINSYHQGFLLKSLLLIEVFLFYSWVFECWQSFQGDWLSYREICVIVVCTTEVTLYIFFLSFTARAMKTICNDTKSNAIIFGLIYQLKWSWVKPLAVLWETLRNVFCLF